MNRQLSRQQFLFLTRFRDQPLDKSALSEPAIIQLTNIRQSSIVLGRRLVYEAICIQDFSALHFFMTGVATR